MAQITWTFGADDSWTDPAGWSTGAVPGTTDDVVIGVNGIYTVTLSEAVTVNSISIVDPSATLSIQDLGGTDIVTDFVDNAGNLDLDTGGSGGSVLSVGGTLSNTGSISVGDPGMTSADTLTVGGQFINAAGFLDINGGSAGGAAARVIVGGAAPGTLTGTAIVTANTGGASLRWGSGAITQLGDGVSNIGSLLIDGATAFVEIGATDSNSALNNLGSIAANGELELDDGAVVTTTTGLTIDNGGSLFLDGSGGGGSRLTVGGNLNNVSDPGSFSNSDIIVGNRNMGAADTLTVQGTFSDANSLLSVTGGAGGSATARMIVTGAALAALEGTYTIIGNAGGASVQWGSGGIAQIGGGAVGDLTIVGDNAFAEIGATDSNNALNSLAAIASNGLLDLEDGAAVNTTGSLSVATGGLLFVSGSTFDPVATTLDVAGAAPGILTGGYDIIAHSFGASLRWGSGGITQIGDGGGGHDSLQIDGDTAYAEVGASNSNSALTNLASIASNGTLSLADGAVLTTTTGLTIDDGGALFADVGGLGGSDVTIGGDLVNNASPESGFAGVLIGNSNLARAVTVSVQGSLDNTGLVDIDGGLSSGAGALLLVAGAAPGILEGTYAIGIDGNGGYQAGNGGAVLRWGSGAITQIGDSAGVGGFLAINGPGSFAEIGATNNNSALNTLGTIASDGVLAVNFGAVVTTTTGLTVDNGGGLLVDGGDTAGGGGGANVTIGGNLVNKSNTAASGDGRLAGVQVGNFADTAASSLTVLGTLDNTGGIVFVSSGIAAGATAKLTVTGAAPATLTGIYIIGPTSTIAAGGVRFFPNAGGAAAQWGSGGITQIGGGTENDGIEIVGTNAFAEVGATNSNSALNNLATIAANAVLSLVQGATVATTAGLTLGSNSELLLDSGLSGPGSKMTVGLGMVNGSFVRLGNTGLTSADTLAVTGTLQNAAGAEIYAVGNVSTAAVRGIIDVGGGVENAGTVLLDTNSLLFLTGGSDYTQSGGDTEIVGTLIAGDVRLNGGTMSLFGGHVAAGTLSVGTGVTLAGFGVVNGTVGAIATSGTISIGGGDVDMAGGSITAAVALGASAGLVGFGTVANALINAGSVEALGGLLSFGTMVSGTGGFTIAAGASLQFAGAVASGDNVAFNGAGAVLEIDDVSAFGGTIGGFAPLDTIDLTALKFVAGATASVAGGVLSVSSGGTTETVALPGFADGTKFATAPDAGGNGTDVIACFVTGTRIDTARGEVRVEDLRPGDLARTVSNRFVPIEWIGHRRIDCARHPDPRLVCPIRIAAGAFQPGQPSRDLWLSPDHAVYVNDVLVPVRLLINGATITREPNWRTVGYFHVELSSHDILLADGLPVESYLDTGNRAMFENAGAPLLLHPGFVGRDEQSRRLTESCAPLMCDPAGVEPLWRSLAARAEATGFALASIELTDDPAPRIIADGMTFAPVGVKDGEYTFVIPSLRGDVRLCSRSAVPSDARPWMEDRRRLGIAVRRITVRSGKRRMDIAMDDPRLTDGWWDVETDDAAIWRWTSGDAVLPVSGDRVIVEVLVGDTPGYRRAA